MNKQINSLSQSHRHLHIHGSFVVGLFGFNPWIIIYALATTKVCMKLKDKMRGGV